MTVIASFLRFRPH